MRYRAATTAVCLIVFVGVSVRPSSSQSAPGSRLFWLSQAEATTDELVKHAIGLKPPQRAVLFGYLAKTWHGRDKVKARAYLKKAIEDVAQIPNRETFAERNERLQSARTLLVLAAKFESELTREINSILSTDVDHDPEEQRNANANAFVQAALTLVDSDPDKALSLGSMSVKLGRTPNMIYLLSKLGMRDQSAGDKLFLEVLAVTERTLDSNMLGALSRLAFIGRVPSESVRKRTLDILADLLLALAQANTVCQFTRIAVPLIPHFRALVPNRAQMVEAAIAKCSNSAYAFGETVTGQDYDPRLKSVDDFLRAADETNNRERRVFLRSWAAGLASQHKDYDRAISILDAFDKEDREEMAEAWDNWRWEYASSAALEYLRAGDISALDRIVHATPTGLRAFVQIAIAGEMNRERHQAKAVELLQDAKRNLTKASRASFEWYLALLRCYVKFLPQEATFVLEDLVRELNRGEQTRDGAIPGDKNDSAFNLTPIELPTSLLQTDSARVRSIIADINAKAMRLRFTLSILECQLRLAEAKPSTSEISSL